MRKQKVGDVRTHSVREENWTRAQLSQLPCTLQKRFRHSSKVLWTRNQFWVQNTERTSLYSFLNCVSISDLSFSWKPLDIDAALSLRPPTCVFSLFGLNHTDLCLECYLKLGWRIHLASPYLGFLSWPSGAGLTWYRLWPSPGTTKCWWLAVYYPPGLFTVLLGLEGWNYRAITLTC